METDSLERLTLLERAQLLHDATLRRHGEMLDVHAEAMTELRGIQERQARLLEALTTIATQHQERMDALQQTLNVIKDMLDRGNGH